MKENRKTKILFMINHLDMGGVERAAVDIVNALDDDKFDITLMVVFKFKRDMYQIRDTVKVKNIFGFYFRGFTKIIQKIPAKWLYKIFIKEKYDYEVAFQAGAPTYILSASTNKDSMRYSWVHGLDMTNPKANDKYDKVIFCGKAVKDHYEQLFADKTKLIVKYNPMQRERIKKLSKKPLPIIKENVITLCSVGRLSEEKGYLRLLDIIKRLKEEGHKLQLWIVGDGDLKTVLSETIRNYNLEEQVILAGYQKNPYMFINNADIYICSSFNEGFNIAATEALLLNKPIVTTDVFGMQELIENSPCGIITENNTEALYKGILKALDQENLNTLKTEAKKRSKIFFKKDPIEEIERLFMQI